MDIKEFEKQFKQDLENGFEPAEWYKHEIKWMIKKIKEVENQRKQ